ncbi:MAG: ribokinase [Nocardioides sp.]
MGVVVVLGSLNVDLVTTVRSLPRPGETVAGDDLRRLPGGKGANQAVAAARAGATVRMCGACGVDDAGDLVVTALADDGVDVTGIRRLDGVATGTATVIVDDRGENVIAIGPGANARLTGTDADGASADLVPGDVLLLQMEVPSMVVRRAAGTARRKGATVVLNAAPADQPVDGVLEAVDVLVVNEHEIRTLAESNGGRPADHARRLAARHGLAVVVTLGVDGALLVDGAGLHTFAAPAVTAIDTVGAGDTFTGYVAAAVARGEDLPSAVSRSVVAASLSVTRTGAQSAIPYATDVDQTPTPPGGPHADSTRQ